MNRYCILKKLPLFFFLIVVSGTVMRAQDSTCPKPPMISSFQVYKRTVQADPLKAMAELKKQIPDIRYDLRYATLNNFMHRYMYPAGTSHTCLRLPAVRALQHVQEELAASGLGLKIFDAYRPWSVTAKFWELVHDENYVANPCNGSGHNRGVAVDLTIIRLQTGEELNMGTGFDNFSDTAHHSFQQLPAEVLKNRQFLKNLMEKNGFKALDTEWWHYSLPDAKKYEILNIPLDHKKWVRSL